MEVGRWAGGWAPGGGGDEGRQAGRLEKVMRLREAGSQEVKE